MATPLRPSATGQGTLADIRKRIVPASEVIEPAAICVFGKQKTGKTRWAASSGLPTLFVDCREKGIETVMAFPNVEVFRVHKYPEIEDVHRLLAAGDHRWKVVVIDTISMAATICMKWLLGDRSTSLIDSMIPQRDQWNQVTQLIENVIIEWRDLPGVHVVFLAQERTDSIKNEEGDEFIERIGPALSPAAQQTLLSAVGTIGRMYIKEVVTDEGKVTMSRRMLLGPHPRYITGTRIQKAPYVMVNPTLGKLLALRAQHGEDAVTDQ